MNVIKETWELIKEYDPENKNEWIFAAVVVLGWFGIWIWMALTNPPSL